jgi:hypothetical protein
MPSSPETALPRSHSAGSSLMVNERYWKRNALPIISLTRMAAWILRKHIRRPVRAT